MYMCAKLTHLSKSWCHLFTHLADLQTSQFCLILEIFKFLYSIALQPQTLKAGVQLQILYARKPYKIF